MKVRQLSAIAVVMLLSGCANGDMNNLVHKEYNSPVCKKLRSDLDTLDSQGAAALSVKARNGGSMSQEQRAVAVRYDSLLAQSLEAYCLAPKPNIIFF